jgi:uncharacterized PurR-regulated membrane protein YhhQ (DUF165 family)
VIGSRLAVLTGLYVAVVCAAQIGANKIVVVPWTSLSVPGGTYLIGVALALIELAHHTAPTRREGALNAQLMILLGFAASALLAGYVALVVHSKAAFPGQGFDRALGSTWRIVGASLAAFIVSETIDNGLGTWMRGRFPEAARVIGTNLVSTPLDSLIFIVLAFGTGRLDLVKGQFVAKMAATVLVGLPLVLAGRRLIQKDDERAVAPARSSEPVRES